MRIRSDGKGGAGFTLIELLVAMAVVMMIVLIMTQIFGQANSGISQVNRKLDTATQCRVAFDRIGYDLSSKVFIPGLPAVQSTKKAGNDELSFYADVRTPADGSRFANLIYKVSKSPQTGVEAGIPVLNRSIASLDWASDPKTPSGWVDEPLSYGIFRLEVAFLTSDGKITTVEPAEKANLRAIIVGVAALDLQSLQKLSDSQVASLASRLPDAVNGRSVIADWRVGLFADLPSFVTGNVRFYERYFYVR